MQFSRIIQHLRRAVLRQDGCELTDGQLLECFVSRRETAALEVLVHRHGPMVWGVCRRILRDHHDAEDACQATFLVLVCRAASVTPREMVGNWLYGVAHQTALKARATRAKRQARERQVTDMPEPAVAVRDVGADWQPLLDQELSRLPNKYRVAIVLCDLEGKTRKEAAGQLGCPEGTLAARLARGRVMLAKRLAAHGLAVSGGMLAGLLSQEVASACVPISVLASTVNAVTLAATGQAVAGAISVNAIALTEGVLKAMLMNKLKNAAATLLVVFFLTVGAAAVITRTSAADQPEKGEAVKKAEKEKADREAVLSDKGEAKAKTRWEYKALSRDEIKALEFKKRGTETAEGGLNMLGDDGWELVAIEPAVHVSPSLGGERPALYVFKRPKK